MITSIFYTNLCSTVAATGLFIFGTWLCDISKIWKSIISIMIFIAILRMTYGPLKNQWINDHAVQPIIENPMDKISFVVNGREISVKRNPVIIKDGTDIKIKISNESKNVLHMVVIKLKFIGASRFVNIKRPEWGHNEIEEEWWNKDNKEEVQFRKDNIYRKDIFELPKLSVEGIGVGKYSANLILACDEFTLDKQFLLIIK